MHKKIVQNIVVIILGIILTVLMNISVWAGSSTNWQWPTSYHSIQNDWPNYSSGSYHGGTDFPVALNSPVYSSCDGEVVDTKRLTTSYGIHIKIKAVVNGGDVVYIRYCHLNDIYVSVGDKVKAGQQIGISGSTGNSTGPHCHYEVRNANDTYNPNLNPRYFLPGSSYSYETWDNPPPSEWPTPLKAYTIGTGNQAVYSSAGGAVESGRYITGSTDLCTISSVNNGWCYVNYPTSSGSRNAYVPLSYFVNSEISHFNFTGKATTTYRRSDLSESLGSIDAGDVCTAVGKSGNNYQVIYPISGGYKLGWIPESAMPNINHEPKGCFDSVDAGVGYIHVTGWAFDPDASSNSINIHIYVGARVGVSGAEGHSVDINGKGIVANVSRPDVNSAYGISGNHGFDVKIPTSKTGSQGVYIYAIDTAGGNNPEIGSKTVTVPVAAKYTIQYNANGGSGAPTSQTKTQGTDLILSDTIPTRTGYTFLGWSTNKDATTATYAAGGKYTTNAAATLYAVWKANTYTINYNANGGSGAPASQTKTYGTDLTLSSTIPTRTGYTFLGWATSQTATTATYTAGGKYTTNAAATLYAVWKAYTYTIIYNANGGTGAPASQTKTYGNDLTLSDITPTRPGYDFLGWATSSTATTATYTAGGKYTSNASVTLYAVWKAKTYTINYNANGGTGVPTSQTKTYGIDLTLSSTTPTRTGYTFLGWSTSSTATTATYSAGDKYTSNASTTLYAIWKVNGFSISYMVDGNIFEVGAVVGSTTTTIGTSTTPTKAGYTFLGWSTSSSATTVTYQNGDKYTSGKDIVLYAVWEKEITILLGDVNNDGDIDFADATLILQVDAGMKTLTADQKTAADVNKDGDVDFADATLVLQYDSGKIKSF